MGLTDWRGWQPNSGRKSACATSSIGFPTTACGELRRMASEAFQPAASTCRTSRSLGRPTCRPGSCGCVSWPATINGRPRIEAKGCPTCATCTRKPKARPPSAPCSAPATTGPATSRRSPGFSLTSSRRSCETAGMVSANCSWRAGACRDHCSLAASRSPTSATFRVRTGAAGSRPGTAVS
jgi:hypothetical protein